MSKNKKVYIAGALTHIGKPDGYRWFYEAIGDLCQRLGLEPYVPHMYTDPWVHKSYTPKEIFVKDTRRIYESDLVIAYLGTTSLGVGIELMCAYTANIPIIVLYERNTRVSRLALGTPTIAAEVVYFDSLDAITQLHDVLISYAPLGIKTSLDRNDIQVLFSNHLPKLHSDRFRLFDGIRLFPFVKRLAGRVLE